MDTEDKFNSSIQDAEALTKTGAHDQSLADRLNGGSGADQTPTEQDQYNTAGSEAGQMTDKLDNEDGLVEGVEENVIKRIGDNNDLENTETVNTDVTNSHTLESVNKVKVDCVKHDKGGSIDDLPNVGNVDTCEVQDIVDNRSAEEDDQRFSDSSEDGSSADRNDGSDESEADDEYESAEEGEEIHVDSQNLKDLEDSLTDKQKEERRQSAQQLKEEGNELFRCGSFKSAIRLYSRGLRTCPLAFPKDRSIMYSNRAACKMKMQENEEAIKDCSKALDLHPHYMKALLRRAELYEKTEKLDEALVDYQKIIEMDPSQHGARAACMRLPEQIKERNEKLKEEMMGKLKDLGNMVLRPFGLSTNNFQLNQDPNTGGYSVNFQQNPGPS